MNSKQLRHLLLRRSLRSLLALPTSVRRTLLGAPPRNDRGDSLDEDLHLIAAMQRAVMPPLMGPDVARSRAAMARGFAATARARAPGVIVEDRAIADRPARLYRPTHAAMQPPALLVFLHGGGWVLGDLRTHDGLCSRLAAEAGVLVLAVDYRRAPEARFPAALEDALAALTQAQALAPSLGVAAHRVGIGGDSAGGNLSAAVAVAARDRGPPGPAWQLLIYPALDIRRLAPSHALFADGPFLTHRDVGRFLELYGATDLTDPRVSPGLTAEASGLPPTVITSAGFDPLRDEDEAFAARLAQAGVAVQHLHHPTLAHGYASMDAAVPAADAAVAALCAATCACVAGLRV